MKDKSNIILAVALLAAGFGWLARGAGAQSSQSRLVRIAELEIDPAQLDSYRSALKEEIEASIRTEPGVNTLYAVAVKDHPAQIRLFEVYTDRAAYQAHLQSPHFKKYKSATQTMVKSLKLVETEPILLGTRLK